MAVQLACLLCDSIYQTIARKLVTKSDKKMNVELPPSDEIIWVLITIIFTKTHI